MNPKHNMETKEKEKVIEEEEDKWSNFKGIESTVAVSKSSKTKKE